MKELLEKCKSFISNHKKIAIPCGVALIVVILLIVKTAIGAGGKTNYFTLLNKNFSTTVGNFDYKIEVRSQEMTTAASEEKELSAEELQNTEASEDVTADTKKEDDILKVNEVINDGSHDDAYTDSWGNATNTVNIDWTYPNYSVEFKGRVESTDPLKMNMNVILATPYNNGSILGVTCIDDKYYLDIATLRNWLLTSQDSYLMELANNIPESAVYVVGSKEEGLHFYSAYAEDSEFEVSGTYDALQMYNRFLVLEQSLTNSLASSLPKKCFSNSQDKYSINVEGENAIQVYSVLKNWINGSGSMYNTYISNLSKNGLATDEQVTQAANEKDNFLDALTDKWVWINSCSTADLQARNLTLKGVSNTYETPNIGTSYEASLGLTFNDTETRTAYNISFTGIKQPLAVNKDNGVVLPSGATMEMKDFRDTCDLESVIDEVVYYLDIFDIFNRNKLKKNGLDVVNSMTDDLVATVNRKNLDNPNWTNITKNNVLDYIKKYSSMEDSEDQYESMNIKLVKNFMLGLNRVKGDAVVTETVVKDAEIEQFREVNAKFKALEFKGVVEETTEGEEVVKEEPTETEEKELSIAEEFVESLTDEELIELIKSKGMKVKEDKFDREATLSSIDVDAMFKDEAKEWEAAQAEETVPSVLDKGGDEDIHIIANVNEDECTSKLVCIDATLMNISDEDITLDLNDFSLQDIENNKYTINYQATLHEYDNGFDMNRAPRTVTISPGTFTDVKFFTVIPDGFAYFDLFYGDSALGDIIAFGN